MRVENWNFELDTFLVMHNYIRKCFSERCSDTFVFSGTSRVLQKIGKIKHGHFISRSQTKFITELLISKDMYKIPITLLIRNNSFSFNYENFVSVYHVYIKV